MLNKYQTIEFLNIHSYKLHEFSGVYILNEISCIKKFPLINFIRI